MKIFDCHNDCVIAIKNERKLKNVASNLNDVCVNFAVWTTHLNEINAVKKMQLAKTLTNQTSNLTSFEDLHFLTTDNLPIVVGLKPDFCGLVWNDDNALGGGAYGSAGLSALGKLAISQLEASGCLIDFAHMNESTFADCARITEKPIFCSHTAFYNMCNSPRNLKDYQCKMICESGGIVGLCFVSDFLSGQRHSHIEDIVNHIEYFATKYGIDALAIGSDFYGTKHLPSGIKSYRDLPKLKDALTAHGFTENEISQIFYKNFERFLSQNHQNTKF